MGGSVGYDAFLVAAPTIGRIRLRNSSKIYISALTKGYDHIDETIPVTLVYILAIHEFEVPSV